MTYGIGLIVSREDSGQTMYTQRRRIIPRVQLIARSLFAAMNANTNDYEITLRDD